MYCAYCGVENADDARFCRACGKATYGDQTEVLAQPTPAQAQPAPAQASQGVSPAAHAVPAMGQAASPTPASPKKKTGVIVAAVIAVIAILAIVFFVFVLGGNSSGAGNSAASSKASESFASAPAEASASNSAESASQGSEKDANRAQEQSAQDSAASAQEQLEQEKQAALDANPEVVYAQPSKSSDVVTMTGVVDVQQGEENLGNGPQKMDVKMIHLPRQVTVSGTQYGDVSSDIVILQNDVDTSNLVGKTVQFNMRLNVRATASIASAKFSPIIASDTTVARVFEDEGGAAQAPAPAPADRNQLAVDAAMALFDKGTFANNEFIPKNVEVSQYLAPGSSAEATYANGWPDVERCVAGNAEVTSSNGNVYDVQVVFTIIRTGEVAARNGAEKAYIANVSLTFNGDDKITDISGKVFL